MPAKKSHKVQLRRAARAKSIRTYTRSRVARARASIDAIPSGEAAATDVKAALRALDRAAGKGVIPANNAARRKSRLARRLAKAVAAG